MGKPCIQPRLPGSPALADGEFAIADVGLRHHGVTVDAAHDGVKARVELVDARQGGRQQLATGDLPGVDHHAQGRGVEVQQWDGGALCQRERVAVRSMSVRTNSSLFSPAFSPIATAE